MLGEAAMTDEDARAYQASYEAAIHAIGNDSGQRGVVDGNGISVKLSALHPRYVWSQRERVMTELLPRLKVLCLLARGYDIGLNIDAEEADRLDLSLDLLEALALDPELAGWEGIGFVVQAYQKRAPFVLDFIIELARRSGHRIMVRLVKGAYWDSEIKRAQVDGLDGYPVFTRKALHRCLLSCLREEAARRARRDLPAVRDPQRPFARGGVPHGGGRVPSRRLRVSVPARHGRDALRPGGGQKHLDRPVRIYAPVGSHQTLLAYLVRRLLENGANTSFVEPDRGRDRGDRRADCRPGSAGRRPEGRAASPIPLPRDIYGAARLNSRGHDLSSELVRRQLAAAIAASHQRVYAAQPMVPGSSAAGPVLQVRNPANRAETVGTVIEADETTTAAALEIAQAAVLEWSVLPPNERAACLTRAAALIEARAPELMALCVREAGKTWANAIAEIRGRSIFLRYYAVEAARFDNLAQRPIGPVVHQPVEFPAGDLYRPGRRRGFRGQPGDRQTGRADALVAALAVTMIHESGVPAAALQLLPGGAKPWAPAGGGRAGSRRDVYRFHRGCAAHQPRARRAAATPC